MAKACFASVAMIAALAITTSTTPLAQRARGGPVEAGTGSLAAARKYLEGRWGLLTFEVLPPGEAPVQVKGAGTLTYDAYGNLEVELRVDEPTARLLEMAGIPSTKGVVSMKGRTVVDMQRRTLTYMLEGQPPFGAPSNPLALNRQRHWDVEGDVLTLTTKGEDGAALSVGRWQKVP
jgi:hypothetical protein